MSSLWVLWSLSTFLSLLGFPVRIKSFYKYLWFLSLTFWMLTLVMIWKVKGMKNVALVLRFRLRFDDWDIIKVTWHPSRDRFNVNNRRKLNQVGPTPPKPSCQKWNSLHKIICKINNTFQTSIRSFAPAQPII